MSKKLRGKWRYTLKILKISQIFLCCCTPITPLLAVPFFPVQGTNNAQESISTQDGTVCTQALGGRTSLNVGVYGNKKSSHSSLSLSRTQDDDFGGFVMLNVPLKSPSRLDCAKLLEIEVERAKIRLKMEKLETLTPTSEESQNPLYQ